LFQKQQRFHLSGTRPSKLSLAIPENIDFSKITELPSQPDTWDFVATQAERKILQSEADDIPLYEGCANVLRIDADRDMKVPGSFILQTLLFMDIAERRILSFADSGTGDSTRARSTYFRRIGYSAMPSHGSSFHRTANNDTYD